MGTHLLCTYYVVIDAGRDTASLRSASVVVAGSGSDSGTLPDPRAVRSNASTCICHFL